MKEIQSTIARRFAQVANYVARLRLEGVDYFFVDTAEDARMEAALASADELASTFQDAIRGKPVQTQTLKDFQLVVKRLEDAITAGKINEQAVPGEVSLIAKRVSHLIASASHQHDNGPDGGQPSVEIRRHSQEVSPSAGWAVDARQNGSIKG